GLPISALLLRSLRRAEGDGARHDAGRDGGGLNEGVAHEGARDERAGHEGAREERFEHEGARNKDAIVFLVFFTILPVALAFAASRVLPFSVWGARHVIVSAAPYLMLAGVALARLRPFWLRAVALVLVCCWFFAVGA